MRASRCCACALAALGIASAPLFAVAAPVDTAAALSEPVQRDAASDEPDEDLAAQPRWHGTRLEWSHSVTTQTVGVGGEALSRNPFYEMTLSFRPRYYLIEDNAQALSLRGDLGVFREFTSSDSTTARGEWSLTDLALFAEYARVLARAPGYVTRAGVLAPVLELPTSEASRRLELVLRLGAAVFAEQKFPLAGTDAAWFNAARARLSAGYTHTVTDATEPTADDFQRVRLSPNGRALPGNQLGGAALARHQLSLGAELELAVQRRVAWSIAAGMRPSWAYAFDENNDVCIEIATGCAAPERVADPQRYAVVTLFATNVALELSSAFALSFGYENLTLQLGPDGRRRSVFYSPDARFVLALNTRLDALYSGTRRETAAGAD